MNWRVSLMEQKLPTLLEHLNSHPVFSGIRVTRSLVLCVCFVDRCLFFYFWTLYCLPFIDIRILITPLVSSNSSSSRVYIHLNALIFIVKEGIINKLSWTWQDRAEQLRSEEQTKTKSITRKLCLFFFLLQIITFPFQTSGLHWWRDRYESWIDAC